MKNHGEKSARKHEQAIAALLAEPTLGSAARRCGVSETTLWRWLQDEEFQAAYKAARRSVVDAATTSLQQTATEAVAWPTSRSDVRASGRRGEGRRRDL